MATIINAKPNKEGKVIVRLFRDEYDVTDQLVNGIAFLEVYGKEFEVHAEVKKPAAKTVKVKQAKVKAEKVEVGFIESPDKD